MQNNNVADFIKQNSKNSKKDWRKIIADANRNKKWHEYSSAIAMRIAAAIEDNEELSQVSIANRMNVRAQQINKILKGNQNLTLKTIADISDVIGKELIEFPPYKDTFITVGEIHTTNRFKNYFKSLPLHDTKEEVAFLDSEKAIEYTFTTAAPIMVK